MVDIMLRTFQEQTHVKHSICVIAVNLCYRGVQRIMLINNVLTFLKIKFSINNVIPKWYLIDWIRCST